jgi:hypothetical protein
MLNALGTHGGAVDEGFGGGATFTSVAWVGLEAHRTPTDPQTKEAVKLDGRLLMEGKIFGVDWMPLAN